MKSKSCIICGVDFIAFVDDEQLQPYGGLLFSAPRTYGSNFDTMNGHSYISCFICDVCIANKKDLWYFSEVKNTTTHHLFEDDRE